MTILFFMVFEVLKTVMIRQLFQLHADKYL